MNDRINPPLKLKKIINMETMVVEWFKEKRNYIYVCFFKISYINFLLFYIASILKF